MNSYDILQIIVLFSLILIWTPLLGGYMAKVFMGENHLLACWGQPFEKLIYKIIGVDSTQEMNWKEYLRAVLVFNFLGFLLLFSLLLFQGCLPLNPQRISGLSWHLALNTAISFMTNTNWQSYSGETALSYFSQMVGLTVQNFLSAATGLAVLLVFIRGLSQRTTEGLGNFWKDTTQSILYVFLPLSLVYALLLSGQGVVQNFAPTQTVTTVEGGQQKIPLGPAASQIAIKQLGTNGGGFFNANSSHPFENPTPFSNFIGLIALILIPSALTYMFGKMVGNLKQGWVLWAVMMVLLLVGLGLSLRSEYSTNLVFNGTIMEGKETRFGITNSVLWSVLTTAASNGSVNSMHSSLSPISGGVALLNIVLGEIIFGGVGCGLYGMILFVILTVFLSGLMVGRTPEYLGKKIEAKDIQMTTLAILIPSAFILLGAGISAVLPEGLSSLSHKGPHGLTEIIYAFASAGGNNGSAFAGLNANTLYYNLLLSCVMLVGRFAVLVPVMVIAGNMVQKKIAQPSFGTFNTDNTLFALLLIGVIFIVGALTFFPALALGPIVEQILMIQGRTF
ncbi:MAG: potassium-transporting ATPase subunit KdpA [Bdellovibrionales bacterium]|nr:potassium-transporting ATPase subunit KdpA [Bdellovibrionales bacterium]